jgi:hypothetical protein
MKTKDCPMHEHQSTIAIVIFIVVALIIAICTSCSDKLCPAYQQVGNMKSLTSY